MKLRKIALFFGYFSAILCLLVFLVFPAEAAKIQALPFTANSNDFVRVEGDHFLLGGQRWYPNGINYFPFYALDIPATQAPSPNHWFRNGVYDRSAVEADLALIRDLGMNMVSVGLPADGNENKWINFVDFLERCERHRLKIFLFLPYANPTGTDFNPARLTEIFTDPTLNLPNRPQIFAYDIAWEPSLGDENDRARWSGDFSRWLASTYRDLEEAGNALGFPIPRQGNGYQAGFLRYEMPMIVPVGQAFSGTFVVKNTGNIVWNPAQGFALGIRTDGGGLRAQLPRIVNPGEEVSVTVQFPSRSAPGRYRYTIGMLQEMVRWFGDMEIEVEVAAGGSQVRKSINLPAPVVGPTDDQLVNNGPWSGFVQAYRRAVDTEISRRYGEAVRLIRSYVPFQLISARQGFAGNGPVMGTYSTAHYILDLASTGPHLDFLCSEGYELYILDRDYIRKGMATVTAYARWASGGRPVFWMEFGYNLLNNTDPTTPPLNNQGRYYSLFLDSLLETEGDGSAGWWYPGGLRRDENSDWGIFNPDRSERPVCSAYRERANSLISPRPPRSGQSVHNFVLLGGGVGGFTDIYLEARSSALQALNQGKRFIMQPQGTGTDSNANPIRSIGNWGATRDLWADISEVELRIGAGGQWLKVMPGGVYAVPQSTPIYAKAKVKNLGPVAWVAGNVRFGANENHGLGFRWPIPRQVNRLEELTIPEIILTPGLTLDGDVQFQMVAEGRTWIDGSLRIRLVPYAGSGGCQNICQAGARQCSSGNTYQVCGDSNADGCFDWGQSQTCTTGQVCQDGTCVTPSQCRRGEVLINGQCSPLALVKAKKGTDLSSLPCPAGYQLAGSWLTGLGMSDGLPRGVGFDKTQIDSGVMWLCSADPNKVKTVIAWSDCGTPGTVCQGEVLGAWHVGNSCGGQISGADFSGKRTQAGWLGLCVSSAVGAKVEVAHNDCSGCGSATGCGSWLDVGAWKPDPGSCGCENGRPKAPIGSGASGGLISSGWMGICMDAR